MKSYTVKCPKCGTLNKNLFLEETKGTYECEWCGHLGLISGYRRLPKHEIRIKSHASEKKKHNRRLKPLFA